MIFGVSQDRRTALLALAGAGLLWGLTVPLSKLALGWLDPLWLNVARFGVAAPVLALAARRALPGALTVRVAAWGVVLYGGVMALQNLGIDRTSVTHASLILGAAPALVAVAVAVTGQGRPGPLAMVGFAAAAAGVVLLSGAGGEATDSGDALVAGCALLSALHITAQRRVLRGRDPLAVTAVQMGAGALLTAPFAVAAEGLPGAPASLASGVAVAALATVGALPFVLYAHGQARVPALLAGAFVNAEPLVGTAAGALLFADSLRAGAGGGGGGHRRGYRPQRGLGPRRGATPRWPRPRPPRRGEGARAAREGRGRRVAPTSSAERSSRPRCGFGGSSCSWA